MTAVLLQSGFEGGPLGVAIVFRDVNTYLVIGLSLEVGDAGEKDAVLLAVDIDKVVAVFQFESTNDLLARNRADLLVQE